MIKKIFGIKEKASEEKKNTEFLSYLEKFVLPECKMGNVCLFDDAQSVFVISADKQLQTDVATANEALLRDMSVKRLLWLSENFRHCSDPYYACLYDDRRRSRQDINISRNRFVHLTDSQYAATIKLGTFASNGYYRQHCMERLRDVEDSLPFLILRMNDWVVQIREEAYKLSQQRMRICGLYEFFLSLPILEKVKASERRTDTHICSLEIQAENLVRQKLQSAPDETLDEIHNYEIQIKNAVYRFINRTPVLERKQMERLLASEQTGYGKMLLILAIFNQEHYDPLLAEKIQYGAKPLYEAYLQNRTGFMADYFLRLLLKEPSWARLPYLLTLCRDENLTERQSRDITAGICERHMYGNVSKQEAALIRSLLEQKRDIIPEHIRRGILFDLKCVEKG